jgi:hypothetical protein
VKALAGEGLQAASFALALALAGCDGKAPLRPGGGQGGGPATPPSERAEARMPAPLAASCSVTCPRLEAVGPLVELDGPFDDRGLAGASIAFADGHWYAAWGSSAPPVARLQRFTADGRVDGDARVINGSTAGPLLASGANELTLVGWVPEAYTPEGYMRSVFALAPDLSSRRPPLLVRSPGIVRHDVDVALDGDALVVTELDARPSALVRELRVDGASLRGQVPARDWRPATASNSRGVVRFGDERFFLDVADGALRTTPLLETGALGEPRRAFELPTGPGLRYIVFGARVAGGWWVGARGVAADDRTVKLVRLDPATRDPLGPPIELDWPGGNPSALLDVNGTPMLRDRVEPLGAPSRDSFVPVDEKARAVCAPIMVSLASSSRNYPTVLAVHFEGAEGAAVVDVVGEEQHHTYFTRLRCGP